MEQVREQLVIAGRLENVGPVVAPLNEVLCQSWYEYSRCSRHADRFATSVLAGAAAFQPDISEWLLDEEKTASYLWMTVCKFCNLESPR